MRIELSKTFLSRVHYSALALIGSCLVITLLIGLLAGPNGITTAALAALLAAEVITGALFFLFLRYFVLAPLGESLGGIRSIADEIVDGNLDFEIAMGDENAFSCLGDTLGQVRETLKVQRDQIGGYLQQIEEVNTALSQKVASLSLIAEANSILSGSLDLPLKVQDFCALLGTKTPFTRQVLYLLDADNHHFTRFFPAENEFPKNLESSEAANLIFAARKLLSLDHTGLAEIFQASDLSHVIGIGSEYNPLALLFLKSAREVTSADAYLLEILGGNAASSISNSLLFANSESTKNQLDQKVFNLMSIHQSGKILSSTLDMDLLLQLSLDIFLETVWANKGFISLRNPDSGELEVRSHKGLSEEEIRESLSKIGEQAIRESLSQDKIPVISGEFSSGSMGYTNYKLVDSGDFSLYIPLLKEDNIYGILQVGPKINGQPFSDNDLEFLVTLCSQVVISFENARLYSLAITDGMTRLYLHRYFQIRLEEEVSRSLRYQTPLSLLMLDIDKFKSFNDTYGHQQGDIILIHVARIIKSQIRQTDIASRYGGEEFSVILPETPLEEARIVAERIRRFIEETPFPDLAGKPALRVTISIGGASIPINALKKEMLIKKADEALYQAKESGRNRVILCQLVDSKALDLNFKARPSSNLLNNSGEEGGGIDRTGGAPSRRRGDALEEGSPTP